MIIRDAVFQTVEDGFEAMLRQGRLSYGEIRDRQSGRLQTLTYAALLWQLFRSLIEGALEGLVRDLGRKIRFFRKVRVSS